MKEGYTERALYARRINRLLHYIDEQNPESHNYQTQEAHRLLREYLGVVIGERTLEDTYKGIE